ncbi:MAG: DUF3500 domain-containing protein, partial [Caldilineaceae bacterium]|nr:DUF3500 domain-containing protein [Caldilineaceae bacterium]
FTQMDRTQQRLAQALVATGLSRTGFVTASTIMGIETTLDFIEGWKRADGGRDSRLYYLSIFGTPDSTSAWGWRFKGHHISLNYTIVNGQIVAPTPTFFGSNPAEAPLSDRHSLRPLASVEDLGRELMHALSEEQRAKVLLSPKAPLDIVSLNRPYLKEGMLPAFTPGLDEDVAVNYEFSTLDTLTKQRGMTMAELEAVRAGSVPKGLAGADMNQSQQEILRSLIGAYLHKMPEELAELEFKQLEARGMGQLHFAWAGGLERRQGHYYRIQGPRFLVEYDNTQNDANHIHSVWRDPEDDFGANILAHHYAMAH